MGVLYILSVDDKNALEREDVIIFQTLFLLAQLTSAPAALFPMLRVNAPPEVSEVYWHMMQGGGNIVCFTEEDDPRVIDCLWDDPSTRDEQYDVMFVAEYRPVPTIEGGLFDITRIYWADRMMQTVRLWDPMGEINNLVHDSGVCISMCDFIRLADPSIYNNFCDPRTRESSDPDNPKVAI